MVSKEVNWGVWGILKTLPHGKQTCGGIGDREHVWLNAYKNNYIKHCALKLSIEYYIEHKLWSINIIRIRFKFL